jgi:3-oxoacyl-[acyl-carrier protein] reductase
VALITGGTRGIGAAIAETLAKDGFSLVLVYKSDDKSAMSTLQKLDPLTSVILIKADVRKSAECERAVAEAQKRFGFIDTLVNNAGISHFAFFDNETQQDYDEVMDTNFRSAFTFSTLLSKEMLSRKFGRIVNISSIWGQLGASTEVLYSASKSAMIGFTRALNAELSPSGILVGAVCPGAIDTDMNKRFSGKDLEAILADIPSGKLGTPQSVADVVKRLVSETGTTGGEVVNLF